MRMTTMTDLAWTGASVRTSKVLQRFWSNDADEGDDNDGDYDEHNDKDGDDDRFDLDRWLCGN